MSTGRTKGAQFVRKFVDSSSHGVFAVDSTGRVVFSNGVLESCLGFESMERRDDRLDDLAGDGVLTDLRTVATDRSGETVKFTLWDSDGQKVRMRASCEAVDFDGERYLTVWFHEQTLRSEETGEDARWTGSQPDTVRVGDVTDLGYELLTAEDEDAVTEIGLTALERLFGTDVACIWLFDGTNDEFERVATTERASELVATRPTFDLNRSLAARAFRRETTVVDRPGQVDAEHVVGRANLHVPLDGQGTLTVFGTGDDLPARDVERVENVASLVAASLQRSDTDSGSPTSTFGTGEAYELPISEVVTDGVEAETHEAIGRRVCERLVGTDLYSGAWFVTTDIQGDWRTVEASVGQTNSPPASVRRARTETDVDREDPIGRAIDTDDVCLVRNHQTVRKGQSGTEGDSYPDRDETVETTVVVPVSHVDRTYGVLVLRSDSKQECDASMRSELNVLGDIVGLAAYAAENKKLLLSEKVQQLEFEVTDPNCLAVAVSDAVDAFCEIEHRTLTNDGDHLCYLRVESTSPETVRRVTAEVDTVSDCQVVEAGTDDCLLEVVKTQSGAEAMMDVGATVQRATADQGVGTLIVETPLSADVREVVDAYTDLNPGSRLVAKRELDRSVPTTDWLTESIDDVLTDKQRSVLTAAYYAGYFEWPRSNTAEEIADSLEISPATFHQHLRAAERKLFDLVCEQQAHRHER